LKILKTDRLVLRHVSVDDAPFIVELLNDPSWLRFIGDKGVRTPADAREYILRGPVDMYQRLGFGLYLAELRDGGAPIGLCGLIKRDSLDNVDVGYALLPRYREQGYAHEAASAVLAYGRDVLGLKRIVAITSPDNDASSGLLARLGFRFQRSLKFGDDMHDVSLYATEL
jgi:RimJ/RimL family protein N-acetyltransferase